MDLMLSIAQFAIDFSCAFMGGLAVMIVISWMVSLFPGKRDY